MADFVQTMKDWKRMCNAIGQEDEYTACDKCDLRSFGCPAIYEKECADADWEHVEKVVVTWAAEHPEPKYPTWWEWLVAQDIITEYGRIECGGSGTCGIFTDKGERPIPADLAQKLGLKPKEG